LLGDIDTAQVLEHVLGLLATNVDTHKAGANGSEGRLSPIIVPRNVAGLAGGAGSGSDGAGEIEASESLGREGSEERSGEDGGEHGDKVVNESWVVGWLKWGF